MIFENVVEQCKSKLDEVLKKLKSTENKYPELKKECIDKARIKVLYSQYEVIDNMIVLNLVSEEVAEEGRKKILDSIEKYLYE